MSDDAKKTVTISILDKQYQVACPKGEQVALLTSARQLDQRMREVKDGSRVIGTDRIAVMAGLNIINELIAREADSNAQSRYNSETMERMHSKVDQALSRFGGGED